MKTGRNLSHSAKITKNLKILVGNKIVGLKFSRPKFHSEANFFFHFWPNFFNREDTMLEKLSGQCQLDEGGIDLKSLAMDISNHESRP